MQQTQEVTHTNCLNHEVSIIFAKKILLNALLNGNGLPPSVSFALLSTFRRTIQKVDFSQFMKCSWLFIFTILFLTFTHFSFSG